MATLGAIAEAIKLIDTKKENLKKAYDDLQSHSSLLSSSFSLSWSDLDSHFSQIQESLNQRFRLLESSLSTQSQSTLSKLGSSTRSPSAAAHEPGLSDPPSPGREELELSTQSPSVAVDVPSSSNPPGEIFPGLELSGEFQLQSGPSEPVNPGNQGRVDSVVTRPELRTLCEKMDGKGLRKFINENSKNRESIRAELPGAIRAAPDPGMLVLDAMDGFYGPNNESKSDRDPEFCGIRRACVLLLEILLGINENIREEVKEGAKKLAFEWKRKVRVDEESSLEVLGFLHLVAAYGLGCHFQKNDLVEYFLSVAKYRQSTLLCKAIDLGDKIQDLIQRLIDSGKQFLAVRFIFEFELADKYPPVQLLKTYLEETKKLVKQICKDGNNSIKSQNEATDKEISALKAVIKVIEDRKLESEYPKEILEKRVQQLQKQKADRKRPPAKTRPPAPTKPQQKPPQKFQKSKKQQQNGNKRPRFEHPRAEQPPGLLPEYSATAYLNSQAGPYSSMGPTPAVAYGGTPVGYPGNSNYAAPSLYAPEPQMPSGYYGGYGVPPQYHASYYPR